MLRNKILTTTYPIYSFSLYTMRTILAILFLIISTQAIAADSIIVRYTTALRIEHPPKIDGFINEDEWAGAEIATDFIQSEPIPGKPASQKTEVRILYDDAAIYVGAIMYDVAADSIMKQLSNRDDEKNTDLFGVFFDTYDDDQNAYGFVVHPTGVQVDARFSSTIGLDISWDAVWHSEVRIDSTNWYVEMKIPYSAIRFSKEEEQIWGVNFARKIRRHTEFSQWNYINPEIDGFVNQFGQLNGIRGIRSPIRLSFVPYISGYYENYKDPATSTNTDTYSINGGMDLKYGINDAFTLDMTLIPDFGQVQSDDQVLNLSPFETKFQERRPFFMEGTELFKKGGMFYSRRIGGVPSGFYDVQYQLDSSETIVNNPSEVQLINSTKISGRTKSNLGIGVLNALTARSFATVENELGERRKIETEPMVNYNVFALDQSLKNNSSISFLNTNVTREGSATDANVTGAKAILKNKKNSLFVNLRGFLSQKYYNAADSFDLGHKYGLNLRKIGGQLQYGMWYNVESDRYDPNDLGFIHNNNSRSIGAHMSYNTYKPFWKIQKSWSNLGFDYSHLYFPDVFTSFGINIGGGATFRNYLTAGLWQYHQPIESYDYFEPRVEGRFYTIPTNYNFGGFFSSDYRKKFALDGNINYRTYNETGRYRFNYFIEPRYRVNDYLSFEYEFGSINYIKDVGYATVDSVDIIFGKRNFITIINELSMDYIFTNRMGLSLRLRHYWSRVNYKDYFVLDENGYLATSNYSGIDTLGVPLNNENYNAFKIYVVYTWVFSPGSEIRLVWKNDIGKRDPNIINDYYRNLEDVFDFGLQTNNFSIKILYYLDYLSLRRKGAAS